MFKATAAFVGGALIGVAIWQLALRAALEDPASVAGLSSSTLAEVAPEVGLRQASFFEARVAALRAANELSEAAAIEQAIERIARASRFADQDARLEALLLRFVATDPHRAARFAAGLSIDPPFLVTMWRAWADVDPQAALAGLAEIPGASVRRQVAIGLVGASARTREQIEALATVAGEGNPSGFVVDALAHLASIDAPGAFQQAIALETPSLRRQAAERIAAEWAQRDASGALSHMPEISSPLLRNLFHAAVVKEWISWDPERALEHLASVEGQRLLSILPSNDMLRPIAQKLAMLRPAEALTVASVLPGAAGDGLRYSVLEQLVDRDLAGASTRLSSAAGEERLELTILIALAHGRGDAQQALKWAAGLDQLSTIARSAIISEVGQRDPLLAFDLALESGGSFVPAPGQAAELTTDEFLSLADRLVAAGRPREQLVDTLMKSWPGRDPSGLWNWLVRQGPSGNASLVRSVASAFASHDVILPVQSIYELPDGLRAEWVKTFAGAYAQTQPDRAVEWLRGLQAEPGYSEWAVQVATMLVRPVERGDPSLPLFAQPAARIADTLPQVPPDLARSIAASWAISEPREAAEWAVDRPDVNARMAAVSAGVGRWTIEDADAAGRWVLGLPSGEVRDRALVAQVAQAIASHGSVSEHVVDAFGSRDDFQQVIAENRAIFSEAFRFLATRDAGSATALVDRYVDDSALRLAIRSDIDAAAESRRSLNKDLLLRGISSGP